MTLETQRLTLAPWQSADWTDFKPIATDPEVMRHITGGDPWTDELIQSFVARQMKLYSERGFCRWKLIEKNTGALIGFCGVGAWRELADLEIGWWLARRCWGQGLATEAATVALQDVFERAMLDRVISVARVQNTASIRIMEKLGLRLEGYFESDGVRLVRYAIDRADYSQKHGKL